MALDAVETKPQMSMQTTSAPLAANSTAIARPIPRAAPVTTAVLPVSIEPRPGRMGPALCSGEGSGMGWPFNSRGSVSERPSGVAAARGARCGRSDGGAQHRAAHEEIAACGI